MGFTAAVTFRPTPKPIRVKPRVTFRPAFKPAPPRDQFVSRSPVTGEVIGQVPTMTAAQMSTRLTQAERGQQQWARMSIPERANGLRRVAKQLEARSDELVREIVRETGKPSAQAKSEVELSVAALNHFADHGEAYLKPYTAEGRTVHYRPGGIIAGITPFNYPLWQIFRFAAPPLIGGNAVVVKPALETPRTAQLVERVFREAGLPKGVYQNLFIDKAEVQSLLADPRVYRVNFTGGTRTGRIIAGMAGENLKGVTAELGGSNAGLVLPGANLALAARALARSRTLNAGQVCIATKRAIFVGSDAEYRQFLSTLKAELQRVQVGDPKDPRVTMGPMISRRARSELQRQVNESVAQGARLLLGGQTPAGRGSYYPPTLLADVPPSAAAFREETFGPVLTVTRAKNVKEAIALANDSEFGLGASVFTQNKKLFDAVASRLDVGAVLHNAPHTSAPGMPTGGTKLSGIARGNSRHAVWDAAKITMLAEDPSLGR